MRETASRLSGETDRAGEFVTRLVRLLEQRAAALGVTREAYLDGMISGTYPPITSHEIDAVRPTTEPAAQA